MEEEKSAIILELSPTESVALRAWIDASPEKIVLPNPSDVLSMDGAADVRMDETDGCISFHLSVNAGDLVGARGLATSLLRAIVDDSERLYRWVPDYGSTNSDTLVFWDDVLKTHRKRVPGKLIYSDPDFIVVASTHENCVSAWFHPEDELGRGVMLWDKRAIRPLKQAINAEGEHHRFTRRGLAARCLPEAVEFTFTGLGGVPALVERRQKENARLLEGHLLASNVNLAFELLYVDPDLIYARDWMSRVFWLFYRRDGLPEKRNYKDRDGKRHAERATAAMTPAAKSQNVFRKWVEKQDYGFDVTAA